MTYQQFSQQLMADGFERVERDDRLLDVFPTETREKGIELWEKWGEKEVKILRLHLPFSEKRMKIYSLSRGEIEAMLLKNEIVSLEDAILQLRAAPYKTPLHPPYQGDKRRFLP